MDDLVEMLKSVGAIIEGHFIGNSGRHLSTYVNKDAFLPRTDIVSSLGRKIAEVNADRNIDIVAGPAVGGIPLSQWTAHHLSELTGKRVLAVFTEKTPENGQVLKRGYDKIVQGKRVLAVEDTVTTGASVKKTIDALKSAGGDVIELTLIVNRDPEKVNESTLGVHLSSLVEIPLQSFAENEVPDWLQKIPVSTEYGHGAKYLKEKGMTQ